MPGSVARLARPSRAWHDRARLGMKASSCHVTLAGNRRELAFVVSGRRQDTDVRVPEFLDDFARQPGVLRLEWKALA
jgi:hypothetical protein